MCFFRHRLGFVFKSSSRDIEKDLIVVELTLELERLFIDAMYSSML